MKGNRIELYEDANGRWRWRVLSGNNKIVASGEQAHRSYYYALTKAKRSGGLNAPVEKLPWKTNGTA